MQIGQSQKFQWNETLGGPHLFLIEEWRRFWRGSDGWRGLDTTDTSDYARACQVKTWLGEVPCHTGSALVLSGDRGPIAWIAKSNCDGGFLIQWIGIDNEDDIKPALQSRDLAGVLGGPRAQEIEFSTGPSGVMHLFDSAEPGDQLRGDNQVVVLKSGDYRMRAGYFDSMSLKMVVREIVRV
jgi:hypothetical protein